MNHTDSVFLFQHKKNLSVNTLQVFLLYIWQLEIFRLRLLTEYTLEQLFEKIFLQYLNIWLLLIDWLTLLLGQLNTTWRVWHLFLCSHTHTHTLPQAFVGWQGWMIGVPLQQSPVCAFLYLFMRCWLTRRAGSGVFLHPAKWQDGTCEASVCVLWDDVAASESGLAGFLREGPGSRHTERQETRGADWN